MFSAYKTREVDTKYVIMGYLATMSNRDDFETWHLHILWRSQFHSETFRFFRIILNSKFPPNWRFGTCKFVFSKLSKTKSTGVANIETDYQRYNQTVSESRVRNISGRAMLPDSTVYKLSEHTACYTMPKSTVQSLLKICLWVSQMIIWATARQNQQYAKTRIILMLLREDSED